MFLFVSDPPVLLRSGLTRMQPGAHVTLPLNVSPPALPSSPSVDKWFVTHSDKRVTKALGRSRDNRREHHPGVNLSMYCFWFCFYITGRLFYPILTAHSPFRPIQDFKTHFKLQKLILDWKFETGHSEGSKHQKWYNQRLEFNVCERSRYVQRVSKALNGKMVYIKHEMRVLLSYFKRVQSGTFVCFIA